MGCPRVLTLRNVILIFSSSVPTGRRLPHHRPVQPLAHRGGPGGVRAARRARVPAAAVLAPHVVPQRGAVQPHGHGGAGEPAQFHAIATAQVD